MRKPDQTRASALEALTVEPLTIAPAHGEQPDTGEFKHWRWHLAAERVAWVLLDKQDESTNTLSEAVLREFNDLLGRLEMVAPKALVIRSAKANGFIAGAEISEFTEMLDPAAVEQRISEGLQVLDRLEAFRAPTIALIHGFCLGGGLELALACKHRIARDDSKLGFPEVLLGLHPGLAGTWRSLRTAEPQAAMTAMLTGRALNARRAKRAGFVDAVVPERHMAEAVNFAINGKLKSAKAASSLRARLLRSGLGRKFAASQMEKQAAAAARPAHYPAPYAMIDLWREHGGNLQALRAAETPSFAALMTGDTSRELVRAFFLRENLKEHGKHADHGISHVHVIGAGIMGGDIAAWAALNGYQVTLQDRETKYIAPAIGRAAKLFKRKLKRPGDARAALDRLIPDLAGDGVSRADLVIEAVPENIDIKRAVYEAAEARMKKTAILATNTSSILLETLAEGLQAPERFVGIHFFNPVAKMMLVEIVTHGRLKKAVRDRAAAFINAIDKLPLPVKSAPGFLVNRALTPYLMEAFICHDEGISLEDIDTAAEAFGMPMGPIELADRVGLDVGLHVAGVLREELGEAMPEIPAWFARKVEVGDLGAKSGRGMYTWRDGKPQKKKTETPPPSELQDRLVLPLLNACVSCLRQGVVASEDEIDGGMIFGTGFAPFRGGPMRYARTRGFTDIIATLDQLATKHGPRFTPDDGWKKFEPTDTEK
jgi:3-hydroxyacyl-CoA dehydrogenase/enoyl-CoA hydratase/3-hydroxybutyryl-CoA epimerase